MSGPRDKAERLVGGAFLVSAGAGVGLTGVYVFGGHPQAEGALLALALGGLGVGIVSFGRYVLRHVEEEQERGDLASPTSDREQVTEALEEGFGEGVVIERRSFLTRAFAGAVGAMGLAALFPIWSLGPSPGRSMFRTAWRPGSRLVNQQGDLITVDSLAVGGVLTVFPEGREHDSDSQTLLIRVDPGSLRPRRGREDWTPDGYIAYSKVCTHAGCPVALYQTETQTLLCPCHQSTFSVLDGARPVFGPATRSLPQLPLVVDDQGYLRAQDDYEEPVGPAFWDRDRR